MNVNVAVFTISWQCINKKLVYAHFGSRKTRDIILGIEENKSWKDAIKDAIQIFASYQECDEHIQVCVTIVCRTQVATGRFFFSNSADFSHGGKCRIVTHLEITLC